MRKYALCIVLMLGIGSFIGCGSMPLDNAQEVLRSNVENEMDLELDDESEYDEKGAEVTEDSVKKLTETPITEPSEATCPTSEPTATEEPTAMSKTTVIPKATATPRPTSTETPVIDRNAVERDAYAVNGKNGKIHKTGDCPATGNGKNAMDNPVYFGTYEEAEVYSIKIKRSLDKRKCGNCWR